MDRQSQLNSFLAATLAMTWKQVRTRQGAEPHLNRPKVSCPGITRQIGIDSEYIPNASQVVQAPNGVLKEKKSTEGEVRNHVPASFNIDLRSFGSDQ